MRPRRTRLLVAMLLVVAVLTGCVPSPGGTAGAAGPGGDPRTGPGLAYGLAPAPDQGVTFQPDVVLVEGGGDAVVSVTADGLTWTLKKSAGGIGDLALDRVMFLTDRGVGRVAAIQTTDAGVEVTIGPVDITDVIADGDFESAEPVALTEPIAISAAGSFWSDPALQQEAGVEPGAGSDLPIETAAFQAPVEAPRPPAPAAIVAETIKATTGNFELSSHCCGDGVGTDFHYDKNGLTMDGSVKLRMSKPTATFKLRIARGDVAEAGVRVAGAGGLDATLRAVAQPNSATNGASPPLLLDHAFSIPIGVFFGVPLSMVVTQKFIMTVMIPGTATLDAVGKVDLGATIGFSYADGTFTNLSSATLDSDGSLAGTNSIAVGTSYASFEYYIRFTVGLGYLGFVAGVFVAVGVHITASVSAPFGFNQLPGAPPIEQCRGIQGELWLDYGVGYSIPSVVEHLVNYFLKAFGSRPIPREGGLSHGWEPIFTKYVVHPDTALCK